MGGARRLEGHAFISYVHEDSTKVNALEYALKAAGVRVWRDTADLWPGEDWRAKIRHAITGDALVFIACFSHRSVAKEKSYQNAELILAVEQLRLRRPDVPWLIPVRFEDCAIPDYDIGGGRTLASIQRADLFGEHRSEATSRLVAAVLRILDQHQTIFVAEPSPAESPASGQRGSSRGVPNTPLFTPGPRPGGPARPVPAGVSSRRARVTTAYVLHDGGILGDSMITPIWLATDTPGAPLDVSRRVSGIEAFAITPDGRTAYVASHGPDYVTHRLGITPVSLPDGMIGTTIDVGYGVAIAITPDGQGAYVVNAWEGTVTPVSLASSEAFRPIRVGNGPRGIAITPDGLTAYVTNYDDGTITPIDLARQRPGFPVKVGKNPAAIAIAPGGRVAYVLTGEIGRLSRGFAGRGRRDSPLLGHRAVTPVDLSSGTARAPIKAGNWLTALAITPDGRMAYVTNYRDGTVTPIELANETTRAPIRVGNGPRAIAITPDGQTAYIANYDDNTVTPVNLAAGIPDVPIEVGKAPMEIVIP